MEVRRPFLYRHHQRFPRDGRFAGDSIHYAVAEGGFGAPNRLGQQRADLAAEPRSALMQLSINNGAATHTGAEENAQRVRGSARGPEAVFAVNPHVHIIAQMHLYPKLALEVASDIATFQTQQIGRAADRELVTVNLAGTGYPNAHQHKFVLCG